MGRGWGWGWGGGMGSSAEAEACDRAGAAPAPAACGDGRAAGTTATADGGRRRVASIDHLRAISMLSVIAHHFAGCGMMALCFGRPDSVREAWSDELLLPGTRRSLLRVWPRLLTKMCARARMALPPPPLMPRDAPRARRTVRR